MGTKWVLWQCRLSPSSLAPETSLEILQGRAKKKKKKKKRANTVLVTFEFNCYATKKSLTKYAT